MRINRLIDDIILEPLAVSKIKRHSTHQKDPTHPSVYLNGVTSENFYHRILLSYFLLLTQKLRSISLHTGSYFISYSLYEEISGSNHIDEYQFEEYLKKLYEVPIDFNPSLIKGKSLKKVYNVLLEMHKNS